MCGSRPKTPKPAPIAPILPEAPDASKRQTIVKDDDGERRRRAGSQNGTVLTGNRGLTETADGNSSSRSLLGGS